MRPLSPPGSRWVGRYYLLLLLLLLLFLLFLLFRLFLLLLLLLLLQRSTACRHAAGQPASQGAGASGDRGPGHRLPATYRRASEAVAACGRTCRGRSSR